MDSMDHLEFIVFPVPETEPQVVNEPQTKTVQTIVFNSTGEFTISDTLSQANALAVFDLVRDLHPLKQAAFKFMQEMLPEVPDSMLNKPEHIRKLLVAKQEINAILYASRND